MNEHAGAARPTLILAGGGHVHIEILRRFIDQSPLPFDIRLISPTRSLAYSGMLPAAIAGHYARADMHVELAPLAAGANAAFIQSQVIGIEADTQRVTLADGRTLSYDLLSLDIGSAPITLAQTADAVPLIPVKPVESLWAGLDRLDADFGQHTRSAHLAVVGGGAGGVELALALAHRCRRWRHRPHLTLYSGGSQLLPSHARAVRQRLLDALTDAGIEIRCQSRVQVVTARGLQMADHTEQAADAVFCATGAVAPGWLADSGLALDDRGFVSVGWDLASPSHGNVFATGDIASLPEPRPKSGVFAVREAPTLAANLQRYAQGEALETFQAQRESLALITLGHTQAVASRGWPIAPVGYAIWRIKDRIDRGFMARYRDLTPRA